MLNNNDNNNEVYKILWDFETQTDNRNHVKNTRCIFKKNLFPKGLHRSSRSHSESKESDKLAEYLDLARELKELWNMKVTVIPTTVGAFATITEHLEKIARTEGQKIRKTAKTP